MIDDIKNNAFKVENVMAEINKLKLSDPEKAESLMAALGKDGITDTVKEWTRLQSVTKSYFDSLRSWLTEDTDVEGKGFFYDISKVSSDLETKLNKISLQTAKAKEMLAQLSGVGQDSMEIAIRALVENGVDEELAKKFWSVWVTEGSATIDETAQEMADKVTAAAREKVTGLAKSYLEDTYFLDGVDLSNVSDKTMDQLRTLKEKLVGILNSLDVSGEQSVVLADLGIDVDNLSAETLADPAVSKALDETTLSTLRLMLAVQKAGGSWDDFTEAVKKAVNEGLKNIDEEERKDINEFGRAFIENVTSMASAWEEFAEVTGDDTLSGMIEALQAVGSIVTSVLERLAKGDTVGALVAAFAGVWQEIAKAVTASAKLKEAIKDAATEAEQLKFSASLTEGVESIFGTNTLKNVRNATEALKELKAATSSEITMAAPVTIEWKTSWLTGTKMDNLRNMISELGYDYLDEYGNLNADALQKILETYDGLSEKSKDWINDAINYSNNYKAAMEEIDKASEDLFGDIADSAAETIVDSWIEAGNAALDYADILDDVAQSYAKMVVKSAILDQFFDEKKAEEVASLFASGNREKAMAKIAEALKQVSDAAPIIEEILEAFDPYFNKTGTSSGSTLGESIQNSITEEQANLLASYINAMRADLSYMRGRQSEYFDYMLGALPTLADHIAAIDASTYDMALTNAAIAESTASALAELRSIISTGTGLPAVRIETA